MSASFIALKMIRFYQKFVSPYKGFNCAYRVVMGETSCSRYGYRVIERFGVMKGYALLRRRFDDCKWCATTHRAHESAERKNNPTPTNGAALAMQGTYLRYRSQRGSVDCSGCDGCSGCDAAHCDLPHCSNPFAHCGQCDSVAACDSAKNCVPDFVINNCANVTDCGFGENRGSQSNSIFREKREKRNFSKYQNHHQSAKEDKQSDKQSDEELHEGADE